MTNKSKIIYYDTAKNKYQVGTIENLKPNQVKVCTTGHFINTVCQLFEDITPKIGDNPMFQDIDWSKIKTEKSNGQYA